MSLRSACALLAALAVAFPGMALAAPPAEPSVSLFMDVIRASNQANGQTDPLLQKMKQKFSRQGFAYQSYQRVLTESVALMKGHPSQTKLPNGVVAAMKLNELRGNHAFIHVNVPPVDADYELGEHGSVYVMAGSDKDGVLIVRLSRRPLQ